MSQKSITSFFTKTTSTSTTAESSIRDDDDSGKNSDENSPIKQKRKNKRFRLESDSESDTSPSKKKADFKDVNAENESATEIDAKKSPKGAKMDFEESPEKIIPKKSPDSMKIDSDKSAEKISVKKSPKTPETNSDKAAKKKSNKKSPKGVKTDSDRSSEKSSPLSKSTKSDSDTESSTENDENDENDEKEKVKQKVFGNIFNIKNKKNAAEAKNSKSGNAQYNPAKDRYHPVDDAIWSKNERVPYLALAKTLEEIEKISARLKIVEILSNFFRSVIVLTPVDLLPSVYLCLNKLAPTFESVELGIAETTLMKAIVQSTGRSLQQIKSECSTTGDIGIVAEKSRTNQRMMIQPAHLTIKGVFDKLKDIAQMTGNAVVSKKIDKIQSIFVACKQSESRYVFRSLAGKLRVGLAEQSVLQALAVACATTPPCDDADDTTRVLNAAKGLSTEQFKATVDEQALILKTAYCECPNYDLVIPAILKYGIKELPTHCKLSPGMPLKPMLAHPTKGIHEVLHRFENIEFTCEWKYDGERGQIHVPAMETDDGLVPNFDQSSIYSRNLENNTTKYPDVLKRMKSILKPSVTSCVLDCEVVAWDSDKKQILPFQVLSTRKRKDAKDDDIKVSVCLFMFDLLYLNGEPLVKRPFEDRRKLLRENFTETTGECQFATSLDCNDTESIQEFLEESIRGNCEGLMIKTLRGKEASYEIARRSRNWLKLKKDYIEGIGDTIDAVVLGGYLGRGKRAGVYGGFLLACYDKDSEEYQTLCKIGTGFSDEDLQTHSNTLKEHIIDGPRNYYRYDQALEPDHWFTPTLVWEVKCGDLSLSPIHKAGVGIVDPEKGISLRFPRFIRIRDDKTPEEATSAHQIADLYCNQDQVKNQNQHGTKTIEEEFY